MRTPTTFSELVGLVLLFINYLIPFLFAVIFLFTIFKLIDAWVINAGDDKKQAEGKSLAITAVIVLVVLISAWGLIAIVRNTFFGL